MCKRRLFLFTLIFALLFAPMMMHAQDLSGSWKGTLQKAGLPLVFTFASDGSGSVDSTKQNFHSSATISISGADVTITVPAIQGKFTGTLKNGTAAGTWSQGDGYSESLSLIKQ